MPESSEFQFDFSPPKVRRVDFTFLDLDETRAFSPKGDDSWDPTVPGTPFGDYEVIGSLGQGAMSQVLRGRHSKTGERVAIKILRKRLDKNEKIRERFRREAVAVSKVRHPNIIDVYLYGIVHRRPFMVLELLEGGTVGDLLGRRRRSGKAVKLDRAVDLAKQTLAGLGAAHAQGLLHRDVKPDNLILSRGGHLKVADFGLVKVLAESAEMSITVTGAVVGTPLYMAPEQLESAKKAEARSDLYSAGVTLYQLLTGKLPFHQGRTPNALHALQASGPAPRVSEIRDGVPRALDAFVARLLEFKPRKRFTNAAQAVAALDEAMPPPGRIALRLRSGEEDLYNGRLDRGQKLVIGRAPEADVTYDGKGLSRFHCQLQLTKRGVLVTDLDSTNGTFVHGRKLDRPALLSRRDVLRLGKAPPVAVRWGAL